MLARSQKTSSVNSIALRTSMYKTCFSLTNFNALVRPLLQYGAVVWSVFTKNDVRLFEIFQNHFIGLAGYCFTNTQPPHNNPVNGILVLDSLSKRHIRFCVNFTRRLIEEHIEQLCLLEQLRCLQLVFQITPVFNDPLT